MFDIHISWEKGIRRLKKAGESATRAIHNAWLLVGELAMQRS